MILISDASVRFSPEGAAQVDASLRISGGTFIYCHTYQAEPPILSVKDRHVSVTVTVPDRDTITSGDLDTARRLADAVAAYIAELESRMAAQGPAAEDEAA
jgi:hypothetical protein